MGKVIKNNIWIFLGGVLITSIVVFGLVDIFLVKAQEIKIIPNSYTGDPPTGEAGWQNSEAVFSQDLGEYATFEEFNTENSAYPSEIPAEKITVLPQEELSKEEIATPTEEITVSPEKEEIATPTEEIAVPTEEEVATPTEEITVPPEETQEGEANPISFLSSSFKIFWNKFLQFSQIKIQQSKILVNNVKNFFKNSSSIFLAQLGVREQPPTLILSDFSAFPTEERKIQNVQLRMSLAGKGVVGDKLIIDYFYQDAWQSLAEFNLENEISNAINGGYFLYALPIFGSWQDLDNLKIRFISQGTSNIRIYLDSLWLEVEYGEEEPPQLIKTKPQPMGERKDFRSDEELEFIIPQKGVWLENLIEKIKGFFQPELKTYQKILIAPNGQAAAADLILEKVGEDLQLKIKKGRNFRPGKYFVNVEISEKGQIYKLEKEFTWGVLAINTNKSIYLPNGQAFLQMAVLDEQGHTVCDADLTLEITAPDGTKTILKTGGESIQVQQQEEEIQEEEVQEETGIGEGQEQQEEQQPEEEIATPTEEITVSPEEEEIIEEDQTQNQGQDQEQQQEEQGNGGVSLGNKIKTFFGGLVNKIGESLAYLRLNISRFTASVVETKEWTTSTPGTENIIYRSSECGPDSVTYTPDYYTHYNVGGAGVYQLNLTATTKNGTYSTTDSFEVRDGIPFEIERIGPTRIYLFSMYEMKIIVKTNQDFLGEIKELVPAFFEVTTHPSAQIEILGGVKEISWQVDWKADESHELRYSFYVPDISPYLYSLGPLEIADFKEMRFWQIAVDAEVKIPIFASNPLHKCSVQPFSQTVKRGEEINYLISLTPSTQNAPFLLSLGNLPFGISATLSELSGRAPSEITLKFNVHPDTQVGSFSLMIIYQEEQNDGTLLSNLCQLNLIIEE